MGGSVFRIFGVWIWVSFEVFFCGLCDFCFRVVVGREGLFVPTLVRMVSFFFLESWFGSVVWTWSMLRMWVR